MKYPILYDAKEKDFFTMGLGPLSKTIEAKVTEERNGAFYLELKTIHDERIKENMIIKTDAGHLLKDQRFVVKKITDNLDGTASIYATHCSYLTQELTLKPKPGLFELDGQEAMEMWKFNILEDNPFIVNSDIRTKGTTNWRIDKVTNPRQALGGVDGSILSVWGGEFRFNNYQISLLQKRGTTANVPLIYGRNITGFEMVSDVESMYTSVYPFSIHHDSEKDEDIVTTIDGLVVDVEGIENYPNRFTLPVDFSSEFDDDKNPVSKEKLVELAKKYIKNNQIGVPKVNIKVNFVDLSKTADYAEYKALEEVNLCDEVKVIYPKLNVNTTAKVIRIVWNCLTEEYDELEIGQKQVSLGSQLNDKLNDVINKADDMDKKMYQIFVSADGKNLIFYGLFGEDGLGEPEARNVGDMWYKPNGEDTEFYIWNGTIWEFIMSTGKFGEIEDKIEEAEKDIEDANKKAEDGLARAEEAIAKAGFAEIKIGEQISKLEQNLNGFKTTVQDTYANKTEVVQLSTLWQQTTELANGNKSQISSLGDQLNLRVTRDELAEEVEKNKNLIKELSNVNWQPGQYREKYPNQVIDEYKETEIIGLPPELKYAIVTTEVGTLKDQKVTQSAKTNDGTYVRTETGSYTWSKWSKVADTSNILTQINLSDEGVLIKGKKIMIDGETYIENGVIKDAMIGTVTADKIVTGTFNGANVNIINLNGRSIVSQSITGDKLAVNAIQVGLNAMGNVIKISPQDLNFYDTNGYISQKITGRETEFFSKTTNGKMVGAIGSIPYDLFEGRDKNGVSISLKDNNAFFSIAKSDNSFAVSWTPKVNMGKSKNNIGWNFYDDINFWSGGQTIKIGNTWLGSLTNVPGLMTDDTKIGIGLAGGTLWFWDKSGQSISLTEIFKKLRG